MEMAIQGVFGDFVALTLRVFKETEGNSKYQVSLCCLPRFYLHFLI